MAVKFGECDDEESDGNDEIDPNDVKALEIVDQNVLHLPINLPSLLPNIKKLVVRNSKLIAISKDELTGFNGLLEVAVTINDLATLPSDTFAQSPNLKTIDISGNKLTELPSGLFGQLKDLHFVNASSNALKELKDDLFASQNNITELNFGNNKITTIAQKFFRNLKKLQVADFKGNECINLRMPEDMKLTELKGEIMDNC